MGRATIDNDLGFGQYRVSLDFGQDTLTAKIAALQARIADLEAEQATLESNVTQAQSDVLTAQSNLNSAISSYRASIEAGGSTGKSEVQAATRLALAAQILLQDATSALKRNKFEIAEAQSRAEYLEGFNLTETRDVWCADYTLEASGSVATAEVPGEADAIVIVPGADAPVDADGAATARPAQESHQFYFNYAILPGWQKFSPTYRFGQITAIDRENDTCDITLEAATSSAQDLSVNQSDTLTAVPIEYMTCDAAAFEVWDYVLVRFEGASWSSPKVVGFKEEPRPCAPAQISFFLEEIFPEGSATQVYEVGQQVGSAPLGWVIDPTPDDPLDGIEETIQTLSYGGHTKAIKNYTNDPVSNVVVNFIAPTPPYDDDQGSGDPTVVDVFVHGDVRIRFDRAYSADRISSAGWQFGFLPTLRVNYREATHGASFDMAPIVGNNVTAFLSGNVAIKQPAYNVSPALFVWEGEEELGYGPDNPAVERDVLVGTSETESFLNRWVDSNNVERLPDPTTLSNFIKSMYSPPSEILIDVGDGVDVQYQLRYIGPVPAAFGQSNPLEVYDRMYATYIRKDLA